MRTFGFICAWVLLIPLSSIWYGFILSILWSWFVVPVLHAPTLSVAPAIGLAMAVRMITNMPSAREKEEKKEAGEALRESAILSFLYPLLVLASGAVVHLFV